VHHYFWPAWTIMISAVLVALRGLRRLERRAADRRDSLTP
jgi:hypothetical protein